MATHIVFTGPDGCGKSTHVQRMASLLAPRHKVVVNRAVRYDPTYGRALVGIMDHLLDFVEQEDNPGYFLHDRWNYPEEVIYPRVMAGEITDVAKNAVKIEERINQIPKIWFVVINAAAETLIERLSSRGGEDYVEMKHLHGLSIAYEHFASSSTIKNLMYVWDNGKTPKELIYRNMVDEMSKKGIF